MFRKNALNKNKNDAFGEVIVVPKASFIISSILLTAIVASILIFISINSYEKKERVFGYLVPDKGLVKVTTPRDGFVKKVFFNNGEPIAKGEIIAVIQSQITDVLGITQSDGLVAEYAKQIVYLEQKLEQKKNTSLVDNKRLIFSISSGMQEIEILQKQLAIELEKLTLAKEEYSLIQGIGDKNYLTSSEINRSHQTKLSIEAATEQIYLQILRQESAIERDRLLIEQMEYTFSAYKLDYEQALSELNQKITQTKNNGLYTIESPVDGIISSWQAMEGNSVRSGMPLAVIIPKNAVLEAKLIVSSRAIGFIKVGQKVRLKYDAFPYQRYGSFDGSITRMTQNSLSASELSQTIGISNAKLNNTESSYLVNATLSNLFIAKNGKKIGLQAGMSFRAEIITEEQTLLRWLFDPLFTITRSKA
jgi:membrane fusion protein